jgi:hypothetical protein
MVARINEIMSLFTPAEAPTKVKNPVWQAAKSCCTMELGSMTKTLTATFASAFALVLCMAAGRSALSTGQTSALVRLQASSPGVAQSGHVNVSGNILFGGRLAYGTTAPTSPIEAHGNGSQVPTIYATNDASSGALAILGNGGLLTWNYPYYAGAVRGDTRLANLAGVAGHSEGGFGVAGLSINSTGVMGFSYGGYGGDFNSLSPGYPGLHADNDAGGPAAVFDGTVNVVGPLNVSGWLSATGNASVSGNLLVGSHLAYGTNNPTAPVEIRYNSSQTPAIYATNEYTSGRSAIYGQSGPNPWASSFYAAAVRGDTRAATTAGVSGHSEVGFGIVGRSINSYGTVGYSDNNYGGEFTNNTSATAALHANSFGGGTGAFIEGSGGDVVYVRNNGIGRGLHAVAPGDTALWAETSTGFAGIDARNPGTGYAGYFSGKVAVTGLLSKGGGSFKIDHPLDPENKFLYHSFVESPDMKNIYDGVITTDEKGFATVTMPDWFDALNRDFRYQLTVLSSDTDSWTLARVVQEIKGNTFVIQTSEPKTRVSWQVTGIRQDNFANAHRIPTEESKSVTERGLYLHPTEAGQPIERGIDYQRYQRMSAASKSKKG